MKERITYLKYTFTNAFIILCLMTGTWAVLLCGLFFMLGQHVRSIITVVVWFVVFVMCLVVKRIRYNRYIHFNESNK